MLRSVVVICCILFVNAQIRRLYRHDDYSKLIKNGSNEGEKNSLQAYLAVHIWARQPSAATAADNIKGTHCPRQGEPEYVPMPYVFKYDAPAIGGHSSRQEQGDGNGHVSGSYRLLEDDGRSRIVEYVADDLGFRASISTNEHGTANQNPADVTIYSSADGTHY